MVGGAWPFLVGGVICLVNEIGQTKGTYGGVHEGRVYFHDSLVNQNNGLATLAGSGNACSMVH